MKIKLRKNLLQPFHNYNEEREIERHVSSFFSKKMIQQISGILQKFCTVSLILY